MNNRACFVVPCFNEAARLDKEGWLAMIGSADVDLLFVNDGSADDTLAVLQALAQPHPDRVRVLNLDKNSGKAEAVRQGLLACADYSVVGFADADLATPVAELLRLIEVKRATGKAIVFGARVATAGVDIDRHAWRHYMGRVFATAVSVVLAVRVYDTQCGAKVFENGPALRRALETPFMSPWLFDVELLGRLLEGVAHDGTLARTELLEVPLKTWHDVGGSKVGLKGILRSVVDLGRITWWVNRERRFH